MAQNWDAISGPQNWGTVMFSMIKILGSDILSHIAAADRFRCSLMVECSNAELKILQNKTRPAGQRRMTRPPVIPLWARKARRGRHLPFQKQQGNVIKLPFSKHKKPKCSDFSLMDIGIHSQNMSTFFFCHDNTFADFAGGYFCFI